MTTNDDQIIRDTIRGFRQKEIEPVFEQLNRPSREHYERLWSALGEIGVPMLGMPEERGGLSLSAQARFELLNELGAGCPSLAMGVVLHATALCLVRDAKPSLSSSMEIFEAAESARFALVSSPFGHEDDGFELEVNGARVLHGRRRIVQPFADWLVVRARQGQAQKLVLLRADTDGLAFDGAASAHGLRLLPFGTLEASGVTVPAEHVFDWPEGGQALQEADGLVTAALCGLVREVAERAMRYAVDRYQGGKMIHEHDTIRLMTGPMLLAERALRALSVDTLSASSGRADGASSAFAVELARRAALDAIQVFGGYGYMEDYRVERYLRDANTIETFWVHASAVQRDVAAARFAELVR
jgi:alkylation response protein AidB-like acyl-CoA dehydrogenase